MEIYYHCSSFCFPQDGSVLCKMILGLNEPQLGDVRKISLFLHKEKVTQRSWVLYWIWILYKSVKLECQPTFAFKISFILSEFVFFCTIFLTLTQIPPCAGWWAKHILSPFETSEESWIKTIMFSLFPHSFYLFWVMPMSKTVQNIMHKVLRKTLHSVLSIA